MRVAVFFIVASVVCACAVESNAGDPSVLSAGKRVIAPGDRLTVRWSLGTNTDGINEPTSVTCTTTISHPCPYMLYTHELDVAGDGSTIEWNHATGGTDLNGFPADHHLPWTDLLHLQEDGTIEIDQRGDDGGLRYAATLKPYDAVVDGAGGYNGELTWSLFNVPGHTAFEVGLTYMSSSN